MSKSMINRKWPKNGNVIIYNALDKSAESNYLQSIWLLWKPS